MLDDCLRQHQGQPRRRRRAGGRCRSTTRRPTSCWPAATRSACSSSTAGRCARCCARWRRTTSRTSPPCCALYRPGPDGRQRAQRLRRPQERPQAGRADPPRAGRAAGGDPRRDLRPDRLPGAGHGDRAEGRRLLARQGRPAAPGDGQEEEGDPRQGVRAVLRRHAEQRLLRRARSRRCGTSCVPFSDYAFNKAHTAGYGLVSYWTAYLKANYPAEYMAALLTSVGDDKDKSRGLPGRVPADGHQGAAAGRQRRPTRDFTPVGTDIRFGLAAVRNVGANVVDSIVATRKEKGAFTDFYDFLRKVDAVACNKKVVESLIKAGAFDSLGHTAQGPAGGPRRGDRRVPGRRSATRRSASSTCSATIDAGTTPSWTGVRGRRSRPASGTRCDLLAFEREMLGLYVSDHPLLGVEHVLAAARGRSPIAALAGRATGRRRAAGHASAGILSGGAAPGHQAGRRRGRPRPWRISTARSRCCSSRRPTRWCGQLLAEDAIVRGQGPGRPARRPAAADRDGPVGAGPVRPGPRGPVVVSLPAARCTPPLVERLKEVLASHPGHDRGAPAAGQRRPARPRCGWRTAAGGPDAGADGRPEGAARARPAWPGDARRANRGMMRP